MKRDGSRKGKRSGWMDEKSKVRLKKKEYKEAKKNYYDKQDKSKHMEKKIYNFEWKEMTIRV